MRPAGPPSRSSDRADRDVLVGSALIKRHGDGAYFGMFAIEPARQQQGLGKVIMTQCETAARELWTRLDRPYAMIKIPATRAGIEAPRQGRGDGR